LWTLGWSIFPCWRAASELGKRPLVKWKIYQSRTPSAEEIADWMFRFPNPNIAVVTGAVSGIVVVDCDSHEAAERITRLLADPTPIASTGRGQHFYFAHPGFPLRSILGLLPEVDLKADGGYVLAPDSLHPSGHIYHWIISPEDAQPLPLPTALRTVVADRVERRSRIAINGEPPPHRPLFARDPHRRRSAGRAVLRSERRRLEEIPLGDGNQKQRALAGSAYRLGQLVATGYLDVAEVRDTLLDVWCRRWRKPLHRGERAVIFGLTSGQQNPRVL
jgi:hypothetical protein